MINIYKIFFIVIIALNFSSTLYSQEKRWEELDSVVNVLFQKGLYRDAYQAATEELGIARKIFKPDDINLAISLNNLAINSVKLKKYSESESLFKETLEIYKKILGSTHPDILKILNNYADLFVIQNKYSEAEPLYLTALDIAFNNPEIGYKEKLKSVYYLVGIYFVRKKYIQLESLYYKAINLIDSVQGAGHIDLLVPYNNLSFLYTKQEKYHEALPFCQKAQQIIEKNKGKENPELVKVLNSIAFLENKIGKYPEAEMNSQKAIFIIKNSKGIENKDLIPSMDILVKIYINQGRYSEAENDLNIESNIIAKNRDIDSLNLLEYFNNLGLLYFYQGKFTQSEQLFEHVINILEKIYGSENKEVAISMINLANLYYYQGKYPEAEGLYKEAWKVLKKIEGYEDFKIAKLLNNLGEVYREQGKYSEAENFYKNAISIKEKYLSPQHPDLAKSLNNLASLCFNLGRYPEAEANYKRAIEINEKNGIPFPLDMATYLDNLAVLYYFLDKYSEAEILYKRALEIRKKTLGSWHPDIAVSLGNLAAFYHTVGNYPEADKLYDTALSNLAKQFDQLFSYASEKDKMAFVDKVYLNFQRYYNFVLRYEKENPDLTGKMYNILLWQKGMVISSVNEMIKNIKNSNDKEAKKLLDELRTKREMLVQLYSSESSFENDDFKEYKRRMETFEKESNELEKKLAQKARSFIKENKLLNITWNDIKSKLKKDEAAIEFVCFKYVNKKWTDTSFYAALIISPGTQQYPEFIKLGTEKEIQSIYSLDYRLSIDREPLPRTLQKGNRQFNILWKPLEKYLNGVNRIYISPDGLLNHVSFGVLVDEDGKFLNDKYELRYVSSTKDILTKNGINDSNKYSLLIGNPKFYKETSVINKSDKETIPDVTEKTNNKVRSAFGGDFHSLSDLPATKIEIEEICNILKSKGWVIDTFMSSAAREEVVKNAHSPRILHIATHGFFVPDEDKDFNKLEMNNLNINKNIALTKVNPMLRNGLFFAGVQNSRNADINDDGILTAYEASNLDLIGTELVVLSACQTGLGDIKAGEGIFGLRRAFQVSGAESIVMSLWSVPDKETQEMMCLFYKNWLSGSDKYVAFQEALKQMRENVKVRYKVDSPFYWGAFIMIGK